MNIIKWGSALFSVGIFIAISYIAIILLAFLIAFYSSTVETYSQYNKIISKYNLQKSDQVYLIKTYSCFYKLSAEHLTLIEIENTDIYPNNIDCNKQYKQINTVELIKTHYEKTRGLNNNYTVGIYVIGIILITFICYLVFPKYFFYNTNKALFLILIIWSIVSPVLFFITYRMYSPISEHDFTNISGKTYVISAYDLHNHTYIYSSFFTTGKYYYISDFLEH